MECYRIIDLAQLWHTRPVINGGGLKSFIGLDFQKIGLSCNPDTANPGTDEESTQSYKTAHGQFHFENVRPHQFDLVARARDGTIFVARDVGFDSRVEL